ncbi:uncharacterized protein RAG0_12888 [Rhynchosporium agropyri]|uniref:Uncharacterized protein n=1 Tax=Rhynchosporium agropyri TaxID=914238 RepID=A0A1E1LAQ7_9HELO|nr:uncharacterized protein RAG0_12888 [Rhynchosporium agropyri]
MFFMTKEVLAVEVYDAVCVQIKTANTILQSLGFSVDLNLGPCYYSVQPKK